MNQVRHKQLIIKIITGKTCHDKPFSLRYFRAFGGYPEKTDSKRLCF